MHVELPDPYPGRCRNFRRPDGSEEAVRCLDYEGHDSACTFPEPPPSPSSNSASWSQIYEYPKPWVSPLDPKGAQATAPPGRF